MVYGWCEAVCGGVGVCSRDDAALCVLLCVLLYVLRCAVDRPYVDRPYVHAYWLTEYMPTYSTFTNFACPSFFSHRYLVCRGGNIMSGYVNNDAATAKAIHEGGWYVHNLTGS